MRRLPTTSALAVTLMIVPASRAGVGWPPERFENLQVLPGDVPPRRLIDLMKGFTRALGVRCSHCHVGEDDEPLATYDFPSDDKPAKRKARTMLGMVEAINRDFLSALEGRADPPLAVDCATCHRGISEPRTLQDVLRNSYRKGDVESTLATYHDLRARYHGTASYDFGEVPLAEVAAEVRDSGRLEDALRLYALNVEMNPGSTFAEREHASAAITLAFRKEGAEAGRAAYRELRERYGPEAFPESLLDQLGHRLLGSDRLDLAIAVFELNTHGFPGSGRAYESLGDGYAKRRDRRRAIESYTRALELDPGSESVKGKLIDLRNHEAVEER